MKAADTTLKKLKSSGKIKHEYTNSFKKTEALLYLYPKLPEDHPEKIRVDKALETIINDEYYDVIPSFYFNDVTFTELAKIYDCKYQWISKKRKKLVNLLAKELFPEDVLNEIIEQ
jgi:hypothetical protein